MADGEELEKRAIEELLRETDRARVRAETMGPAGWLKCPLRGTNKRFLLNTLRSSGLQQRTMDARPGHSATRGRLRSKSPDRSRDHSRTPVKRHRSGGGNTDHKHHHRHSRKNKNEKHDRDKERNYRYVDNIGGRHEEDGQRGDKDRHKLHK
ncbi:protein POLR1D [Mastacembelus armatus]|uniref:Si:ch211-140b10.6 n=1 Tax=Mastacembelus armatus TaxID=205130 RepID=A0A7N8XAC7_9TELE|nr:protein POLR1D [Mastacembelus armatus]